MVYKIRNKSFFWTQGGWKNNWFPKDMGPAPAAFNPKATACIVTRYDHHSFLRMHQQYRNLSRYGKQYLYGDSQMEQCFQGFLRTLFHTPFNGETPVHLIRNGGERVMADQLDRDVELFSYNVHPWQFDNYELANRVLDKKLEDAEVRANGELTLEDQIGQEFQRTCDEEKDKLPQGEKLSIEQMTEIMVGCISRARKETSRPQHGKDENGQMKDFDEVRRPFMNPTSNVHTT